MNARQKAAAFISLLLAIAIVTAALLGPLIFGVIRFRMTELLENQYLGGEIVSLFVVAPALAAAGVLWLRNDRLAPALAFGPALYAVYTFVTAILGQEYSRFPGNVEKAFPLYITIIMGGFALALVTGHELVQREAPLPADGLRRVAGGLFLIIVLFFALAWSGQILLVYRGQAPAGYEDSPTLFWLIRMLDLGFLLPAFAVTGIGLLRGWPVVVRLSYGLVSFAVCMSGAILGMAIAMLLRDDPAASVGMVAFLAPVTLGLALLAIRMLGTYRHGGSIGGINRVSEVRHAS